MITKSTPPGVTAAINAANTLPSGDATYIDVAAKFRKSLVDFTKPAPEPKFLLEINGVPMMPAGGLTAITGQAKQGKTQLLAAITATLMSGRPFGSMRRLNAPCRILWCDTEQPLYHLHTTIGRVYAQAGITPGEPSDRHGLHVLNLRPYDADERIEIIRYAVEALRPDVVIIDGLRDLVHDFNDVAESGKAINWLMSAPDEYPGIYIFCVLHTNPGSDKMRGHLGTELTNKFTDTLIVKKENGVFKVTHGAKTAEMLSPFYFCIDGHGLLSPSTAEDATGVLDADAALAAAVPEDGADFESIVRNYAKSAGMPQARARDALKARLNATPPSLVKRGTLFFRVT